MILRMEIVSLGAPPSLLQLDVESVHLTIDDAAVGQTRPQSEYALPTPSYTRT